MPGLYTRASRRLHFLYTCINKPSNADNVILLHKQKHDIILGCLAQIPIPMSGTVVAQAHSKWVCWQREQHGL